VCQTTKSFKSGQAKTDLLLSAVNSPQVVLLRQCLNPAKIFAGAEFSRICQKWLDAGSAGVEIKIR